MWEVLQWVVIVLLVYVFILSEFRWRDRHAMDVELRNAAWRAVNRAENLVYDHSRVEQEDKKP
jgi:hypothetical protein